MRPETAWQAPGPSGREVWPEVTSRPPRRPAAARPSARTFFSVVKNKPSWEPWAPVGTCAVTSNPHYQHFFSPVQTDSCLGALPDWPPQPPLLLLDCIEPDDRSTVLERVARHGYTVSILRLDQPSRWAEADIKKLRKLQAEWEVDLQAKSLVLHHIQCWIAAKSDSKSSCYTSQLWLIRPPLGSGAAYPDPSTVRDRLGSWDNQRCDFHHDPEYTPHSLNSYRASQQDAVRFTGHGRAMVALTGPVN